jgi:hypothetical protein
LALGQDGRDLFSFVGRLATSRVCGNQSGRDDHPDERKANQKIVHVCFSFGCIQPAAGLTCPHLNHPSDQQTVKSHKDRGYRAAGVITFDPNVLLPCSKVKINKGILRLKKHVHVHACIPAR